MRLTQWLDELRDDVRFALRQVTRSPGFTSVAVLTLALGIGANSGIFALADATLLRPLSFTDADRLVMLHERTPTVDRGTVAPFEAAGCQRELTAVSFLPLRRASLPVLV
jgi:hypothetical protein